MFSIASIVSIALPAFIIDPGVVESFPPEDIVLPANAQPVLVLQSPARGTMRVVDSNDDDVDLAPLGRAFIASPQIDGDSLTIAAVCEGCTGVDVVSWQVSDEIDEDAPGFTDEGARDVEAIGIVQRSLTDEVVGYTARFALLPANEPYVLRLEGAGGPHVFLREPYVFIIEGGDAREECFDAFAIDAAGNETAFAEPLCFTLDPANVDEPPSCASTSRTQSAGALLCLLAVLRGARLRRTA